MKYEIKVIVIFGIITGAVIGGTTLGYHVIETKTSIQKLGEMNCNEIIEYTYSGIKYDLKDNREFARDKVDKCIDMQERPIRYAHCETKLLLATLPQSYHGNKDLRIDLLAKVAKCVNNDEIQIEQLPTTTLNKICNIYHTEKALTWCPEIPTVYSQPFTVPLTVEEIHEIVIESEKKIINAIPCDDLYQRYDGKMHDVNWQVHTDLINKAFDECKIHNEPLTPEEKYPVTEDTPNQLKEVYQSCQCKENIKLNPTGKSFCFTIEAHYANETHYINNNSCKWTERINSGISLERTVYEDDFEIDYTENFEDDFE